MKLSNEATLSLSDEDMYALVASALVKNVFDHDHQNIEVSSIELTGDNWWITFTIDREKEE